MSDVLGHVARLAFWLLLPPLLPGLITRVKAVAAGRRGPPVLQLYYDLARLWKKSVVQSSVASPAFIAGPAVAWIALLAAAMLVPVGFVGTGLSFRGDVVLLLYLLALARFATAWAAMETGSAFEGMGAAREVSFAVLAEAALIAAMLTLSVQTRSVSLATMLAPFPGAGALLLAAGLFTVLLAENCRVPFDDPNTHLELTMIHEVMVLDHGGPDLAAIETAAMLKLWLFAGLLAGVVLPVLAPAPLGLAVHVAGVFAVGVGVGAIESAMARLRLARVPQILVALALLALLSLMLGPELAALS
jgi:formate hydrogenlyase subunit 4